MPKAMSYSCVEFCAEGGGQALGLEQAGFRHTAAVLSEPQFGPHFAAQQGLCWLSQERAEEALKERCQTQRTKTTAVGNQRWT